MGFLIRSNKLSVHQQKPLPRFFACTKLGMRGSWGLELPALPSPGLAAPSEPFPQPGLEAALPEMLTN